MQANVIVGLLMVMLFAQAALSLRLMHLHARMARLEGKELELFRSITEVRRWAAQKTRAFRGEVTLAGVDDSATSIRACREKELAPVLEKPANAEEADDAETTFFNPELLRAELHQPARLSSEEEEETPPQGEREVTLVTVFQHPEKEGSP